ncbi:(1-_4)-alpha-D-glucan 1-alpha-D-glucosylmutase [Friedmanniella endophytica]|uniref:(1->4)-alpha-D-glucan 1-alpha-D-glucosylmutase n=1 Tax=Microlunatus kandeliicorticis TaxID=1759536 RepID=A0A7W3IPY7_9ACTN|nr:malto-oligosyltrehalose synthase [Microlunatus kandeliicorticis]MBA8793083.1 (1->4)-alpha-D-glucan 1-alpha-D-glucosylmutase [Microlunatus kandeliicorticis]
MSTTSNAPTATYRLQITPDFTLDQAAALTGYLADLGVGAVYLSPVLTSTTGSDHGYDATDPRTVDPQRGGEAGLAALLRAARADGLAVVTDIVPNHLGISKPVENPAWWDVLTHGRDSAYADWFDIDWSRPRILVPVLGSADDVSALEVTDGELRYYEHRFPLAPGSDQPGRTLQQVHDAQHYELVDYHRGNSELNYRRFFAVETLAGLRVEDEAVFRGTHERIARWVAEGVTGLRVDHPDGLVDPGEYLERLAALAPGAWITVEKILEPGEQLLTSWPVAGTTGYDAMREYTGVFVDTEAEALLTNLYRMTTGDTKELDDHIWDGKVMVVRELLRAEISRLAALAPDVPDADQVIAIAAVAFEVYRSYLPEGREHLDHALEVVLERRPQLADSVRALYPRLTDPADELARRFQQLTGATMAKGVEDTAFYRYNRFVALNEVGGDPSLFGVRPEDFHTAQQTRQEVWPQTMTSLSTHDTKRGEDVRMRLAVLSEQPEAWAEFVAAMIADVPLPEPTFAYLLWQTVAGVGLIEAGRMHAYAEKAMREAALATTWLENDEEFESAVHAAIDRVWSEPELRERVETFHRGLDRAARTNSLGQKLVQLTAPGVPDVYQGTELWEDSLVDPDNRRPVDFAARRALLGSAGQAPAIDADGAAKLHLTRTALRLRRDRPELFAGYRPVTATGPSAAHLLGFDRGGALTLVTRLSHRLAERGGWRETVVALPEGRWTDALTGTVHTGEVQAAALFGTYPVALLTR